MYGDFYGRGLGMSHDSGWGHLSHGAGESPLSSRAGGPSMYGIETIAQATADEMFGGRRGGGGRVRARPMRAAFRAGKAMARQSGGYIQGRGRVGERERAALGSAAWQQGLVPGQDWGSESEDLLGSYDEYAPGSDMLDAEIDAALMEDSYDDEYGMYEDYFGDDDDGIDDDEDDEEFGADEEYGRRGRRRKMMKRAFRAGRAGAHRGPRKMMRKMKQRRQRRRQRREDQFQSAPQFPVQSRSFLPTQYPEEEELSAYQQVAVPGMPGMPPRESVYQQIAVPGMPGMGRPSSSYGNASHFVTPPPKDDTFTHSLKMGLGLGLGFMGVALGVSILSRGLR